MGTLSPTAQAVWDAFNQDEPGVFVDYGDCLAAALRAVAKQLGYCRGPDEHEHLLSKIVDVYDLLAIAAELEGAQ